MKPAKNLSMAAVMISYGDDADFSVGTCDNDDVSQSKHLLFRFVDVAGQPPFVFFSHVDRQCFYHYHGANNDNDEYELQHSPSSII